MLIKSSGNDSWLKNAHVSRDTAPEPYGVLFSFLCLSPHVVFSVIL